MFSDDFLNELRREGDALADNAVSDIESHGEVNQVNALIHHLVHNNEPVLHELPASIQEFFTVASRPPAWVDVNRLKRGADFGATHGLGMMLALSTCSLIQCYAAVKGTQVLSYTHRLEYASNRRAAETAQYVLALFSQDSFSGRGHAIPAILKVRLIHAAVRYLIRNSGRWEGAAMGEAPICQEDLVGSLMAFSVGSLKGMRQLGFSITPEEAEDYYYVWRVAGEMMGIKSDIIPHSVALGEELSSTIARRQWGPSPEGVVLTKALLEMHQHLLPEKIYEGAMPSLIRRMVGDEISDWLEIPHTRWEHVTNHVELLGKLTDAIEPHHALLKHAFIKASRAMIETNVFVMNGFRKVELDIPADLDAAWRGHAG